MRPSIADLGPPWRDDLNPIIPNASPEELYVVEMILRK
jgi:hypothetical protein